MSFFREQYDFNFYATYYYAEIVQKVVNEYNPSNYLSEVNCFFNVIDSLFEEMDYEKLIKPKRKTLLHDFIELIISTDLNDYLFTHIIDDLRANLYNKDNRIALYCSEYQIDYLDLSSQVNKDNEFQNNEAWEKWSDYCYQTIPNEIFDILIPKISIEVFETLFQNRIFLKKFNILLSQKIKEIPFCEENLDILKSEGVLHRCTYWPTWLKDALFFREKGKCAICSCDLSRLLNTDTKPNIDHIVPLALGGTNDPSNFQWICFQCNNQKLGHTIITTNRYNTFWEIND